MRAGFRGVRLVWADAGYAGRLVAWAAVTLGLRVEIVRRHLAHAFQVLPRRWWWSAPSPGSAATAAPSATTSG